MCKGSGGTSNQNQTSSVGIPADVLQNYRDVYSQAQTAAAQPFQSYTGQFVAPVNATQQQGISDIAHADAWINPTYGNATNTLGAGLNGSQPLYNAATGLAGASTGQVNPGALDIQQYMSPYTQNVVDSTTAWLNQQNKQQQTDLTSNAISSGAFGGDRAGIASGVLSGQQNMANASTIAGLYNQNYAQALGAAQQQQGVNLGAGQANRAALQTGAGLLGNLGQTVFNTGLAGSSAYNQYGTQALQSQLGAGQATLGAGQVQQQTSQADLSALYNQFLMQQAYPFQTTQFLSNIAGGLGPLQGSTTTASGSSTQPQPFFSDDKLKENVREIGRTSHGLKIVRYNYKDDPHKLLRIGFLASDVEKKMPEAVTKHAGLRSVDYERAAKAQGGGVAGNDNSQGGFVEPEAMRGAFAAGGGNSPVAGYDPTVLAAILATQKAMYPGAAGRPGVGDNGPRGMALHPSGGHEVMKAPLLDMRQQQQTPELQQALKTGSDLAHAGKDVGDLYTMGRDAVVGSPAKGTVGTTGYIPPSGGLIGNGGKYDWNKGWVGRNTGAGVVPANSNTVTSAPLPDLGTSPPPVDTTTAALADAVPDYYAAHGGRMRRAGGGRGTAGFIPYASDSGYVPVDDFAPFSRTPAGELQSGRALSGNGGGGGGSGGSGLLGNISNLANIGKSAAGLAGMFGGAGAVGADGLPMSGLGAMTGDAALGAAGAFGAADAGGAGIAAALPFLALRTGGRAGFEEGGTPDTYGDSSDPDATNVVPFRRRGGLNPPAALELPRREAITPSTPAAERYNGYTPDPVDTAGTNRYIDTPPEPGFNPSAPRHNDEPPKVPVPRPPTLPAGEFDTPENVAKRHWHQESGDRQFDQNGKLVTSSVGAVGRSQLYDAGPAAAKLAGVEWSPERARTDEAYNRLLGDTWLKHLTDQYGDPYKATAAYNAGAGTIDKAMAKAANMGGNYWDYLPAETQNHLYVVSGGKIGTPAGNATALNAGLPGAAAGPAAPTTAGLAPAAAAPAPPTDRDFLDRAGDWWDRNEKHIIPALSFLGSMLSSPSRTLAASVGTGLVGGAKALQGQQEVGQGQQRIDITQRSQWMSQWAQLRQIYDTQIANNGQVDPQIVAQMHRLARLIGISSTDAVTGGGNSPAGGGSAGLVPTATSPAGGPSALTASPAPSLPAPGSVQPVPPAGNVPSTTPVQPGQPAGDVPPSMRVPTVDFPPGFLNQLAGTTNPVEMRQRAAKMTDPGQAAALRQRADQLQADIIRNGGGQGNNGFVPLPSAGAYRQSQERIADNLAWQTAQQPVFQQRQVMRNNIEQIAKAVQMFEPGAFAQLKADVQAAVKGAPIVGFKPPNTATMNAEEYQTFIKDARNVIMGSATGDQKTDAARQILAEGFADPHLQPKAVRRILAQSLANLDYADAFYRDVNDKMNAAPHINRSMRADEFNKEHPIESYQTGREADLAVRGDLPERITAGDVGRAYIMTPQEMLQLMPKNSNVTLDQLRGKFFDGQNAPRRFRIKNVNGRLAPVAENG